MLGPSPHDGTRELYFECFGVGLAVSTDSAEASAGLALVLPPGRQPCSEKDVTTAFGLRSDERGTYTVVQDGVALAEHLALGHALDVLERQTRMTIALEASEVIFVHAGVVACHGKAILLPGTSFSGKSTLVAALVRAGALYLSDEYAVLDEAGRVHPYARPLSLRVDGVSHEKQPVEQLGGLAGDQPLPVGAVVETSYRSGATWRPRPLSAGEGVLALLNNALPAQSRPEQTLRVIRRSVEEAVVLSGERGEASGAAAALLASLKKGWGG